MVIVEVHGCRIERDWNTDSPWDSMNMFHQLMSNMEEQTYRVYSMEPNMVAQEPGLCVEYGLKRLERCPANTQKAD